MEFIGVATERTTAITDVILAVLTSCSAVVIFQARAADPWKARVWAAAFGLLGVASALGAVAHGLLLDAAALKLLWQPLFLSLGLALALFVVGAVYDFRGPRAARRVLPFMLGAGVAFFLVTQFIQGSFLVFIAYEAVALLVALGIYLRLLAGTRRPGTALMVAGIGITILAAVLQADRSIQFNLVWTFDHNGVFHLVQMPGLLALLAGLRASLAAR